VRQAVSEVTGVLRGRLAVGMVTGCTITPPDGLDALTIVSERLVAAVPPEHPLAGRSRVRLRDVLAHPVVCMPPGTGLRTAFDAACARQSREPAIAAQASAADAIADLAARGLGVGILSESMSEAYRDRLTARTIADAETPRLLAFVWRPAPGPAVCAFLAHARRAFGVTG
jgi:DNA-binding transcriptional LysR family regulator